MIARARRAEGAQGAQAVDSMWSQLLSSKSSISQKSTTQRKAPSSTSIETPTLVRLVEDCLKQSFEVRGHTRGSSAARTRGRTSSKRKNARLHERLRELFEAALVVASHSLEQAEAHELLNQIYALQPALEREKCARSKGGTLAKQHYAPVWAFARRLAREEMPDGCWPSRSAAAKHVLVAVSQFSEQIGVTLTSTDESRKKIIARNLSTEKGIFKPRRKCSV